MIVPMNEQDNLRTIGLKSTFPRRKVLDLFHHAAQRHLSAEDVYKLLVNDNAEIGLATVYRVLQQFEQAGLLIRHHFEGGKAVYELNEGAHHDHIVCVCCGYVEEFTDPEIEKRQEKIARQLGFQIRDHHMVLYAEHCPHCPGK